MSNSGGDVISYSNEETEDADMCDDDSENFQFDLADSNLTASEDENIAYVLSSCTDEIAKSLDSLSTSSIDANMRDSLDGDGCGDSLENFETHQTTPNGTAVLVSSQTNNNKLGSSLNCTPNSFQEILNSPMLDISRVEDLSEVSTISAEFINEPEKVEIIPPSINAYSKKKLKKILLALEKNDIESLRLCAISRGGLLNDGIRKKVWPKLVGVDLVETSPRPTVQEIEAHPYYEQVVMDVNRSLKRFPPSIKEAQRLTMLDQLVFLIMRVLCRHPDFHYYQGYHDICVTFLLVLGEEMAFHVIEKLSRTHLNVFMEKSMEPTIHLLEHIYILIGKKSPQLNNFMVKSDVGVAYCLSWLITWFGHVLNDYDNVVRLFDLFIVSHPWMPMYLTASVVLHRESEVLNQDCDMASVHSLLAKIPDNLPFEEVVLHSLNLHEKYNPMMLAKEHPFVRKNKLKPRRGWSLINSVKRTIKSVVPVTNITVPVVVAAAVLVTAVLYQAYKY